MNTVEVIIMKNCMSWIHLKKSIGRFLFMQQTWNFYLFNKSSEYSTPSLWLTVVSFFPLSITESKAGTHRVEMDSLGPKQRMWNFGATQEGILSFRVSVQETKHNTDYSMNAVIKRFFFLPQTAFLMHCIVVQAFLCYYTSQGKGGSW